jgi:hypothetical protein
VVPLVGEERKRQAVLGLELRVRSLAVRADAVDDRAGALELAPRVADVACLLRAPRCVVLGIEVEDDRLPTQVRKLDALTRVRRKLEVGRRLAFLDHGASLKVGTLAAG